MKKMIADIITSCRIFCSALMIIFPVFSLEFYILYFICGITDMIDGTVARKTNSVSEFGTRLDSVADLMFFAVSLIKILPSIHISKWILMWIVLIAIIKLGSAVWRLTYIKKFIFLHTMMNKITGLILFLLPLTLQFIEIKYSSVAVCIIATFSAIQESVLVKTKNLPY